MIWFSWKFEKSKLLQIQILKENQQQQKFGNLETLNLVEQTYQMIYMMFQLAKKLLKEFKFNIDLELLILLTLFLIQMD